jgi:hypothetical protein
MADTERDLFRGFGPEHTPRKPGTAGELQGEDPRNVRSDLPDFQVSHGELLAQLEQRTGVVFPDGQGDTVASVQRKPTVLIQSEKHDPKADL